MANLAELLKPGTLGARDLEGVCVGVDLDARLRKACGVFKRKRIKDTAEETCEELWRLKEERIARNVAEHVEKQKRAKKHDKKCACSERRRMRKMDATVAMFKQGQEKVCRKHQGKADSQSDIGLYVNFPHRSVEDMYDRVTSDEAVHLYKNVQRVNIRA